MDLFAPLREYGWIGVLVLFLLREFWPWFRDLFASEQKKKEKIAAEKAKVDSERALASIHEDQDSRREERALRQEERHFRHQVDERQVVAFEKQSEALQRMVALQETMNERQGQMIAAQNTMSNFVVESVIAMKETVAQMHGAAAQQQAGKTLTPEQQNLLRQRPPDSTKED